jgi:hypothetical protein
MINRISVLATAGLLFLACVPLAAHQDRGAPPARVVKEYVVEKPLGTVRVTYAAATQPGDKPSLRVECDAFKGEVPAEGLEDLPRPDWGKAEMFYALTDYDLDADKFVDRPYIYVKVPILGPGPETWDRTWVTFHFKPTQGFAGRMIKRFLDAVLLADGKTTSTRELWVDWAIGKSVSAAEAIKQGEARANLP